MAREEAQRTDDHRVRVQTPPGWSVSLSSAVHSQSSGVCAGTETEVTAKARWRGRSHAEFGVFTSAGLDPGRGDVAHGLPCMEFVEDVTTLGNTGTGLRG